MIWLSWTLLLVACLARAEKKPEITSTSFQTPPVNLQYFDDSSNVLVFEPQAGTLWWSKDAGGKWEEANGVQNGDVVSFWLHPTDKERAYALGRKRRHWITKDRGESWKEFTLPNDNAEPSEIRFPLSFSAANPEKVIVNAQVCEDRLCRETSFYTRDDFKKTETLLEDSHGCVFAHGTEEFLPNDKDKHNDRVLCIASGLGSAWAKDNRILVSDDYFEKSHEPRLDGQRTVAGVLSMAVVKRYLVAAVKSEGTSELALYVSQDANQWHRAEFPHNHRLEENAYTILESTNYSIQVDVMTTRPFEPNSMGTLCTSNSNGTYFTENIPYVNRNHMGIVDFEKIQGIQGIVLVNVVSNHKEVENSKSDRIVEKKLQSKISFDDGRTFKDLRIVGEKDAKLHLHSVTDMANSGRIFSSPAPGLVMGVGNAGEYLRPYQEGDLYISSDAGLTWRKGTSDAHKYEFGDQGSVLLAVFDEGPTSEITYSLNHGESWEEVKLPDEDKIAAKVLTTVPDSTSLSFVLEGTKKRSEGIEYMIYKVDFKDVHDRNCVDDDFEELYARLDDDGKPDCLMGQKQKFMRRKPKNECAVKKLFKEAKPVFEPCPCSHEDFECDFNFVRDGDGVGKDLKCEPAGPLALPKGACQGGEKSYEGTSGFRKIPGNQCTGGETKDEEKVKRPCKDTTPPEAGKIKAIGKEFKGRFFQQKVYLEKSASNSGDDESIIMSTRDGDTLTIWHSKDHGKTWKQILDDVDNVKYLVKHRYAKDRIYFLTGSKKLYYSINRGESIEDVKLELPWNGADNPLEFHPDKHDWLLWTGAKNCDRGDTGECHTDTWYSQSGGLDWKPLLRYTSKCEFVKLGKEYEKPREQLVFCEQHKDDLMKNPLQLKSSENWFKDDKEPDFDNIVDFATMSEFIIVAQRDPESNLKVVASKDGKEFADAKFPHNFNVPHRTAYTVLDSSTNAVFLHVTVNDKADFEYGRIMKSNSNGTSYVLSVGAVNRNRLGYVDFEKMQGIDGVALVNVVINTDDENSGNPKQLRSMITHNDGSQWAPLRAPHEKPGGEQWGCNLKDTEKCSLHLHSYTERDDPRDTFSSPSAVGMMMGVGNVGAHLGKKEDDDTHTFITADAGITWKPVRKGSYMWEYGDQGSIIVIVDETRATKYVHFTLDNGDSWQDFQFADSEVDVKDLTTVPSDNSLNFIVWASARPNLYTYNIDFSALRNRTCKLDEDSGSDDEGDFYLWSPKHPMQEDDCLFGRKTQFHRKKSRSECWINNQVKALHDKNVTDACPCTKRDFECDYNYEMASDDTCQLVTGLTPKDHSKICEANPDQIRYFEATGYRKIPISQCVDGDEEEYLGQVHPCPGHEDEFNKRYGGLSGFGFFLVVIILPLTAATLIGWVVYTRFQGSLGRIRLGESGSAVFDADRPWIQYPVVALSAVVAVVAAIPLVVGAGWRLLSGLWRGSRRYTTRQSFARGRGDYAIVDPDEDELLGEDEEDDA